jgi:hypothetical protein
VAIDYFVLKLYDYFILHDYSIYISDYFVYIRRPE